jgi:hypothetical protein
MIALRASSFTLALVAVAQVSAAERSTDFAVTTYSAAYSSPDSSQRVRRAHIVGTP